MSLERVVNINGCCVASGSGGTENRASRGSESSLALRRHATPSRKPASGLRSPPFPSPGYPRKTAYESSQKFHTMKKGVLPILHSNYLVL